MSSPDPTRRSERARTAILTATLELLGEVGFSRLTIEAVAERAGVGKQTIYRWWPAKGAVVFDALLTASTGRDGGHALPDTGDIAADLKTVLRAIVAELDDPATDRLQRTVAAEIQHDRSLAEELVTRLLRPQLDATAARLNAAIAAGQLAPGTDPAMGTELLFGPIFHRWLLRTAPLSEAYTDGLVDVVLAGLTPRG